MKRLIALFVLLSGTFTVSARGQLLNFDFTMTSQSYYDYSNNYSFTEPETYTLMGKIIGLQNNASSAPEDVLITSNSFPDHGGLTGFDQNPYSLDAHSFTEAGEFIVSNGAIVGTSNGGVSYNYLSQTPLYSGAYGPGNSDIWDNFYFNAVSEADGTDGAAGITNVNGQNGGSGLFYSNAAFYGGEEDYNTEGFSGSTYTLDVPEPSMWFPSLSAIGAVFYLRGRGKETRVNCAA
jgi:hypothetical protein